MMTDGSQWSFILNLIVSEYGQRRKLKTKAQLNTGSGTKSSQH